VYWTGAIEGGNFTIEQVAQSGIGFDVDKLRRHVKKTVKVLSKTADITQRHTIITYNSVDIRKYTYSIPIE